jgi:hypothetical protein
MLLYDAVSVLMTHGEPFLLLFECLITKIEYSKKATYQSFMEITFNFNI